MCNITCAVDAKNVLGEAPIWDADEHALYWIDIQNKLLQRFIPETQATTQWRLPERVGSFARRESGGFIMALASTFALFDPAAGKVERLAIPDIQDPHIRLNDGKCDRHGRFWAGTMDETESRQVAALYRLDSDLACHLLESGIGISNGIAWSPDNRTFYFNDSMHGVMFAYDFDLETGAISNRRILCEPSVQPGIPDGSTIDAEGFLWNARWDGWRLVRFAPNGRVDRVIELPFQRPTSCMFGGPNLSTLYVTSAACGLTADELRRQPQAGGLFAIEVGVRGIPEPRFDG